MPEEIPDPLEVVRLLKSDFDALQAVANYAVEDTDTLGELLGLERPEDMAPREFFHTVCLHKIAALLETQDYVDEATTALRQKALRFGNQTKDFGNGVSGLKVGERITDPELLSRINMLPTRAERRRLARETRHER